MNVHDVDLGILEDAQLPADLVEDLLEELGSFPLVLARERRQPAVYAGLHWYLPTLLMLFLTRKLFDSFMSEAGKDLYHAVRESLAKLASRTSGPTADVRATSLTSAEASKKVPPGDVALLSIWAELNDGTRAKFTYVQLLPEGSPTVAVESMMTLLSEHYASNEGRPPVLDAGGVPSSQWGTLPLIFNPVTGLWMPVNSKSPTGDV